MKRARKTPQQEAPAAAPPPPARQLAPAPVPDDAVGRIESLVAKWGEHAAINALLAVLSRPRRNAADALDIVDGVRVAQIRGRLAQ